MTTFGWTLLLAFIGALLCGIAVQIEIIEARHQQDLDDRIREWEAAHQEPANVIDFEEHLDRRRENGKEAA